MRTVLSSRTFALGLTCALVALASIAAPRSASASRGDNSLSGTAFKQARTVRVEAAPVFPSDLKLIAEQKNIPVDTLPSATGSAPVRIGDRIYLKLGDAAAVVWSQVPKEDELAGTQKSIPLNFAIASRMLELRGLMRARERALVDWIKLARLSVLHLNSTVVRDDLLAADHRRFTEELKGFLNEASVNKHIGTHAATFIANANREFQSTYLASTQVFGNSKSGSEQSLGGSAPTATVPSQAGSAAGIDKPLVSP